MSEGKVELATVERRVRQVGSSRVVGLPKGWAPETLAVGRRARLIPTTDGHVLVWAGQEVCLENGSLGRVEARASRRGSEILPLEGLPPELPLEAYIQAARDPLWTILGVRETNERKAATAPAGSIPREHPGRRGEAVEMQSPTRHPIAPPFKTPPNTPAVAPASPGPKSGNNVYDDGEVEPCSSTSQNSMQGDISGPRLLNDDADLVAVEKRRAETEEQDAPACTWLVG